MFDPKSLLDQFLGAGQSVKGRLDQQSGSGGFARGAAVGGVLGLLLGGKGLGRLAGGALGYGGAAAIGALALKAYQDYQQKKSGAPVSLTPEQFANLSPDALPHAQAASDGGPFQLVLIRAMISAAKADGHVDADGASGCLPKWSGMGSIREQRHSSSICCRSPPILTRS